MFTQQTQQERARPDVYCKDLIQSLHHGMEDLQQFAGRQDQQNLNPNTMIVKVTDPTTGQQRLEHKIIGTNFETQSIRSDMSYKWSAIGEMNDQELDQLNLRHGLRMNNLEDQYKVAAQKIQDHLQKQRDAKMDSFTVKERFKDASINYPSYGRGLPHPPKQNMDTYMVQPKMCGDSKDEKRRKASNSGSPQANVQAKQRKRILSPQRQRYEAKFEQFITKKNVDDQLEPKEPPMLDFDT